jgi:hypothetical protein
VTDPILSIAAGLHAARRGFMLTLWGVGGAFVVGLFTICILSAGVGYGGLLFLAVSVGGLLLAVGGIITGVVGRCRCALAAPEDAPAARAAMRLAAVLEVCGWLNTLTTIGVGWITAVGWLTLPEWTFSVSYLLSAVLLVAGRGFFVLFCRRLAKHLGAVDARTSAEITLIGLRFVVGLGLLWGLFVILGAVANSSVYAALAAFGFLAGSGTAMVGVWATVSYVLMVRDLATACRTAAAEDGATGEDVSSEGDASDRHGDAP